MSLKVSDVLARAARMLGNLNTGDGLPSSVGIDGLTAINTSPY